MIVINSWRLYSVSQCVYKWLTICVQKWRKSTLSDSVPLLSVGKNLNSFFHWRTDRCNDFKVWGKLHFHLLLITFSIVRLFISKFILQTSVLKKPSASVIRTYMCNWKMPTITNSRCTGFIWRKEISQARAQKVETQQNSFVFFRMCCGSKKARVYATNEILITPYRFLNMHYPSMSSKP